MSAFPPFEAPFAENDAAIAERLLANRIVNERRSGIETTARALIEAIRAHRGGLGGVEDLLREFSLSTKEGIALMVLAEP